MSNTHLVTLTEDEQFFFEHAGYSYDPDTEGRTSGRVRGAMALTRAELIAKRKGWFVSWDIDHDADTQPTVAYFVSGALHWQAILWESPNGAILASLGSIDLGFAEDGHSPKHPESEPYARVIEAQLAMEAISE